MAMGARPSDAQRSFRPGVLAGLFGRLADQPRERHERDGRDEEQRRLAGVEDEAQEKRDRGQHERRPEKLAAHGD